MSTSDPDSQRSELLDRWEQASVGWGKRADAVQDHGMPISMWLIDHLNLQPGMRLLELAAGPGDTGFLGAELIAPGGGTLISSDGAEGMLRVARERAERRGLRNVEFKQLNLEWIDLETASVDAVVVRWGIMLVVDPSAAAREIRRVLAPGGRFTTAVWDLPERNPWATVAPRTLIDMGLAEPPDPNAPGMFSLAGEGALQDLLEEAGFVDVRVDGVDIERRYASVDAFMEEALDILRSFADAFKEASPEDQATIRARLTEALAPFTASDGTVRLPGRSLVAVANA